MNSRRLIISDLRRIEMDERIGIAAKSHTWRQSNPQYYHQWPFCANINLGNVRIAPGKESSSREREGEVADHLHRLLLRPHREWPSHCASEAHIEFAPSFDQSRRHVDAIASIAMSVVPTIS
jgi:hypothetical protein